jgi:hypothetical protein
MADKKIRVEISAKEALGRGLAQAGAKLKEFGQSAARVGKAIAMGFLAAGTAVAGFAAKALQAYSKQQAAEKSMESALRGHGEEISANMAKVKAFASAIQDETGVGDENVIARAARLRMLGVETTQLEAAAKATIALKSAGMEEAAAIRAVANASQGNFEMLTRYIPALKTATSEAEKAAIVNEFLTRGYAQQKGQLNTVAGQWGALKSRIVDAWEVIGQAIEQNGDFTAGLKNAGDQVKAFGARIASWIADGGASEMLIHIEYVAKESAERFQWLARSAIQIFSNMSSVVGNIWENTTETIGYWLARAHARVTGQEWNLQPPDMKAWNAGIEKLPEMAGKARAEYERKMAGLGNAQDKPVAEETDSADMEQIGIAAANNAKAVEDAKQREIDALKEADKVQQEIKDRQDRDRADELNAELDALNKIKAAREETAKKTVGQFIEEAATRKDEQAAADKDRERGERLRERAAKRGVTLSKKDREFLDAFEAIDAAGEGLKEDDPLMQNIKIAQDNLEQLKLDSKTLADMLDALDKANTIAEDARKEMQQLLRAG